MSAYHKDLATVTSFNIIESYMKLVILPKLVDVDLYIDLIANINILGNSSITISVNMHQPILTRYKSSADGLYSPHITGSNDKAALVNDVSTFIDMIK